jgi:hypothetical protein
MRSAIRYVSVEACAGLALLLLAGVAPATAQSDPTRVRLNIGGTAGRVDSFEHITTYFNDQGKGFRGGVEVQPWRHLALEGQISTGAFPFAHRAPAVWINLRGEPVDGYASSAHDASVRAMTLGVRGLVTPLRYVHLYLQGDLAAVAIESDINVNIGGEAFASLPVDDSWRGFGGAVTAGFRTEGEDFPFGVFADVRALAASGDGRHLGLQSFCAGVSVRVR